MYIYITVLATALFIIFLYFAFTFWKENEKRASFISIITGLAVSLPLFFTSILYPDINYLHVGIFITYTVAGILLTLPIHSYKYKVSREITTRFDERQIMFSRAELMPSSERFAEYYKNNPKHKLLDDKFRLKPGLMSNKSQEYHPLKFASAHANFKVVNLFVSTIKENAINAEKITTNPTILSNYIKKWALQLGVVNVGITQLKDFHLYSIKGRGELYGQPIVNHHSYAIAFTVEMNKEMMDMAPNAETVLESSEQYLRGANIASQLAIFIRNLGFSAKPHFDGNYDLICPLVARDAGLGEFGRMGLLMTPKIGPRVRIGIVTTDIPLITDHYEPEFSVIDFCTKCKKCADNCPSRAISFEKMKDENGISRWRINHEACYTYWTIVGTDCGKCVQVCPYSHPSNFMHNLIRKGVKNSSLFAVLALKMDDLFYGRKPGNRNYISPLN